MKSIWGTSSWINCNGTGDNAGFVLRNLISQKFTHSSERVEVVSHQSLRSEDRQRDPVSMVPAMEIITIRLQFCHLLFNGQKFRV